MRIWTLPPTMRFSVRETEDPDRVAVYKGGRLPKTGRTVDIQPHTRKNLETAAKVIAALRIDPGSISLTNTFFDVHGTGGQSYVIQQVLGMREQQGGYFDPDTLAREALANRAGNCDRVNSAGLRLLSLHEVSDPVLFFWTRDLNHNVVLIGDPRMPKYGEDNTVVLDNHAVFPMPCTLSEANDEVRIPHPGEPDHEDLEEWDPQKDPTPPGGRFDRSRLPEPVSRRKQRQWLQAQGWPTTYGSKVVKKWYEMETALEGGTPPDRWSELFRCRDPGVRYRTPDGHANAYNRFPREFVQQRVKSYMALQEAFPESDCEEQSESGEGLHDMDDMHDMAEGDPADTSGKGFSATPEAAGMNLRRSSSLSSMSTLSELPDDWDMDLDKDDQRKSESVEGRASSPSESSSSSVSEDMEEDEADHAPVGKPVLKLEKDIQLVKTLSKGVWEEAVSLVDKPFIRGVMLEERASSWCYRVSHERCFRSTFAVVDGRDKAVAKALATAVRLEKDRETANRTRSADDAFLASLPKGLRKQAVELAKLAELPRGVHKPHSGTNRYRVRNGGPVAGYAIKLGRDDRKARTMAIAALLAARQGIKLTRIS